jgi:hypothetical protein
MKYYIIDNNSLKSLEVISQSHKQALKSVFQGKVKRATALAFDYVTESNENGFNERFYWEKDCTMHA